MRAGSISGCPRQRRRLRRGAGERGLISSSQLDEDQGSRRPVVDWATEPREWRNQERNFFNASGGRMEHRGKKRAHGVFLELSTFEDEVSGQ